MVLASQLTDIVTLFFSEASPLLGDTLHHDWSDDAVQALLAVNDKEEVPPSSVTDKVVWLTRSIVSGSQELTPIMQMIPII